MRGAPTLLNALTNRADGTAACSFSISDSFGPVKSLRTPFTGGSCVRGLVTSMTSFPEIF
jgi:hypothetical protein